MHGGAGPRGARGKKLIRGLALALLHPNLPSCADCLAYMYDDDWRRSTRGGQPVKRPQGVPTPCHRCPKSEGGRPSPENELTAKNWRAVQLYYEIAGGWRPPLWDAILRRNCGLIRWVLDMVGRLHAEQAALAPLALLARRK